MPMIDVLTFVFAMLAFACHVAQLAMNMNLLPRIKRDDPSLYKKILGPVKESWIEAGNNAEKPRLVAKNLVKSIRNREYSGISPIQYKAYLMTYWLFFVFGLCFVFLAAWTIIEAARS